MKVLSEEEMQNCLVVEILMKLRLYIILNELNNVMKVSSIKLQQIVEKLIYIVCETQLNIIFMIECLSQNLINIKVEHIKVTK